MDDEKEYLLVSNEKSLITTDRSRSSDESRSNEYDVILEKNEEEEMSDKIVDHEDGDLEVEETEGYTMDEAIEALGFGKFQSICVLIVGFSWLADGSEIMMLSILGPFLECEWQLEAWQAALLTTVVFAGLLVGSPTFGYVADQIGRRKSLIINSSIAFVAGLLCAVVSSLVWLLIVRFFVGFGIGGAAQAITYYTEFLPRKHRGRLVVLIQVFWTFGGLLEVVLALALIQTNWRMWMALSAFPILIFLLFSIWLPESPRYDLESGNVERAMTTLKKIEKMNGKELPKGNLIAEPSIPEEIWRVSYLFSDQLTLVTCLLAGIWFIDGFNHFGMVLLTTEMIRAGGTCQGRFSNDKINCQRLTSADYVQLMWTTMSELPGLFLTAYLVDLIGRRRTKVIEIIIYGFCIFLLFICMGRVPMVSLLIVIRCFASATFQVTFLYTSEVYPTKVRALAVGLGSSVSRFAVLITPYVAEVLVQQSLRLPLAVYGSLAVVVCLLSANLPIETMDRGLNQDEDTVQLQETN